MDFSITDLTQLGGQVVVVLLFLRYLTKRDGEWINAQKENSNSNIVLARALQKLTSMVEQNTSKIKENVPEVIKNTEAVKENTDAIETKGK